MFEYLSRMTSKRCFPFASFAPLASTSSRTLAWTSLFLALAGCAGADDVSGSGAAVGTDDVVTGATIRELGCRASSGAKSSEFHFRLSSDGRIHEGTVMRGSTNASPDYRVDVTSVAKDGDRYRIEASEGDYRYRFTLSSAAFDARQPADLDARSEETNDPAVADGQGTNAFQCWVGSVVSPTIDGDEAARLWDALNVTPVKPNPGGETQVKIVAPYGAGGAFKLRCWSSYGNDTCKIELPALVTDVKDGRVTYEYDLAPADAQLVTAGTFSANDVALICTGESCRAKFTLADTFYQWVNE